ncbi:hypothetical protein BC943DRAFT_327437 [Umbelopsis sp. AD052]|nr:hypothetical protein BC943DRAFT_327437 [Umbelopsis sp. AD052]
MLVAIVMLSASWLPSLITAQTTQPCMNLQSSQACPAYQQYYVNIPANTTNYPWLATVSDVPGFDQALFQYANSTQNYLQSLGCTNGAYPTYIPYARYSLSMLCEQIIQDSQDCNAINNLYPGPLCSDTCMSYVASVAQITSNTSLCQPSDLRTSELADLTNRCSTWDGYNGTSARGCISGSSNEPLNCGFQNDTTTACEFCKENSGNACCQTIVGCNYHHGLSGGAIAGIVIGCVAAVTAAVLIYFCFCRRPRRFQKEFPPYVPPQFQNRHQRSFNVLRSGSKQSLVASSPYDPQTVSTSSVIPEDTTPFTHEIEEFYVAVHPYPPQIADELELHVGDVVCLAMIFDDGWGLGFNVNTGLKGAFPLVCVTPASREVLEQVLMGEEEDTQQVMHHVNSHRNDDTYSDAAAYGSYMLQQNTFNLPTSEKRVSQDKLELNMERIRETLRRSMSLSQHSSRPVSSQTLASSLSHSNTIPKRTASMRSAHTGSAPTTPTSPNSPMFGMTPLSNALLRSRNYQQDDDTYEMLNQHRQRNGSVGDNSWMQSS